MPTLREVRNTLISTPPGEEILSMIWDMEEGNHGSAVRRCKWSFCPICGPNLSRSSAPWSVAIPVIVGYVLA